MKAYCITLSLAIFILLPISVFSNFDKECINFSSGEDIDGYCYNLLIEAFDEGSTFFKDGNFSEAVNYYNIAYRYSPNDSSILNNLALSYASLAEEQYEKKDFDSSIKSYKSTLLLGYEDQYYIYYRLVWNQFLKDDSKVTVRVQEYLNELKNSATDNQEFQEYERLLIRLSSEEEVKSNDTLTGMQYYLYSMNIHAAWEKVNKHNENEVVIAVVDDGLYIHHSDLKNNIWSNPNAQYGDSKVVNFTDDELENIAKGEHGTMVAGIIAAEQNNQEGITGIAKNAKIMPLRVFSSTGGTKTNDVVSAINYAVDNGADIINISLGQEQFLYSEDFDEPIKNAYDKGVIVVIAAGNGDILSDRETGVDLTKNPIAPVCNNGGDNSMYSIGVYASDMNGWRTNWTNYGDCAPFMSPGENIVSTSIPIYNEKYGDNYNELSGTSFSAPIISGLVALGFNEYGRVPPDVVWNSLNNSQIKNSEGNYVVDASEYLNELEKYIANNNVSAKEKKEKELKEKYKIEFKQKIGNKLSQYPNEVLEKLIQRIEKFKEGNPQLKSNFIKLDAFIEMLQEYII